MAFIVKVPGLNSGGKTEGCQKAGNEIIKSIKRIHSDESGKLINTSLFDLEEIHLDNSNLELTNKLIYENSFECYETKPKTIYLGGDHSVSYSLTKSFLDYCKKENKTSCLIVFDSHPDLMPVTQEPAHDNWLSKLIEEGFPPENVLLIGLRNSCKEEIIFMKEKRIQQISMNSILEDIDNIADTIMEFANSKETYISIDIDSVDPAFAPATGYPVSGGLSSREMIYLIQRIKKIKNLRAVDIVEINPTLKGGEETVFLGAKILSEFV